MSVPIVLSLLEFYNHKTAIIVHSILQALIEQLLCTRLGDRCER